MFNLHFCICLPILLQKYQEEELNFPLVIKIGTVVVALIVAAAVIYSLFNVVERLWVKYILPKPFFKYIYVKTRKLSKDKIFILNSQFSFYHQLKPKQKTYFEHRVATLLDTYEFIPKSGVFIDDQKQVLVAGTAVMLTFGYRDYKLSTVQRILIYPKAYFSNINKTYHKGEYNPGYKAIVFSWEDFLEGYNLETDNYNLGIHEFVHAMHFEYLRESEHSVTAFIFVHYYNKLMVFLKSNQPYRQQLLESKYLRNYAFTNSFEFIAVVIESFIETPHEFKSQFPEMYSLVRKMLNFNFGKY